MRTSVIQNSFIGGEISPSLFGRTDLSKWHNGASTLRNFFVNYRGGASSRAGTAYVGTCKQSLIDANSPPRLIKFQFNINQGYALEFGHQYMRIISNGAYVIEDGTTISAATNANPMVITDTAHGYSDGDWVFITGMQGMTNLNGLTWIVTSKTTDTYELTDMFGNVVNSTMFGTYAAGGTASRIYTVVAPYAAVDLPFLKFTQSADTMTLCCVNQETGTEYPPYDLVRAGATNWSFNQITFASSIAASTGLVATAHSSTDLSTWYSYVVTAVNANTGEESVASAASNIENNDISVNAGSNSLVWSPVANAGSYNVYSATPSYSVDVPIGSQYGYIGSAFGTQFTDTNIIADFTKVPPTHQDPFARGAIASIAITNGGSGYSQAGVTFTITTAAGSGFIGTPIIVGGAVVAFLIQNGGAGYAAGDTIAFTADGADATATLNFGPTTGTYPSCVAYYQQRRFYANTLDQPDTYFASQPGAFNNMDSSIPTTDSDAIIGAPWAQQINGIQFMQPMTNGLVILTGNGAWVLNGGSASSITPADQTATSQAYNGCHFHIEPLVVNYDILYVQSKGSIIRDLSYNFFVNIFTGTDLTVLSNHLFNYHQMQEWAYAEEPYKIIWVVRDDGVMLSLTYLKEQDVYSWARHDTNGFYVSVASVTEPPVDAVYVIVRRLVQNQWMYYAERMDNRNWTNAENAFCVDAGLRYPMNFPNATLTPDAISGSGNITSVNLIYGGSGYTAPVITAINPFGTGSGASFTATVSGGVITSINVATGGSGYISGSQLLIQDATGSGAVAQPVVSNNVTFNASASVFSSDMVGDVIRIGNNNAGVPDSGITLTGGGQAVITSFISGTQVIANITQPITASIPDDPNDTPVPAISGQWSISTPTQTVTGLNHLEDMEVAIVGDGAVFANQTVQNGAITFPHPVSAISIGLPFICQLQTLYLDPTNSGATVQGKRKNITSVVARFLNSRGVSVGANEPDQSTQPNNANAPWTDMKEIKERNALVPAGSSIPLTTGDHYINIPSEWNEYGQTAIQQTYPLPCDCLALITSYRVGDQ